MTKDRCFNDLQMFGRDLSECTSWLDQGSVPALISDCARPTGPPLMLTKATDALMQSMLVAAGWRKS
jgi:hypothetical protein